MPNFIYRMSLVEGELHAVMSTVDCCQLFHYWM